MTSRGVGMTTETLEVMKGFFRLSEISASVYPCRYAANCIGNSTCLEGSKGLLCSVCEGTHYLGTSEDDT